MHTNDADPNPAVPRPNRSDIQDVTSGPPVVHNDGGELPVIGLPANLTATPAQQGIVVPANQHQHAVAHAYPAPEASLRAVLGDVRRTGVWTLPTRLRVRLILADAHLDLRQAHLQPGESTIEVHSICGDVKVIVPEGLPVEVRGHATGGDEDVDLGATPASGNARLTIRVTGWFGDTKVRALPPGKKPPRRWR